MAVDEFNDVAPKNGSAMMRFMMVVSVVFGLIIALGAWFMADITWEYQGKIVSVYEYQPNIFQKVLAFVLVAVVASITTLLGYRIGKAVRDFALPERVYVSGGMTEIIQTKLFWKMVPQIVGLGCGAAVGFIAMMSISQMIYPDRTEAYQKHIQSEQAKAASRR